MVKSVSQSVENGPTGSALRAAEYSLDPAGRLGEVVESLDGVETSRIKNRFANDGDNPAVTETSTDGGTTWTATRYVTVPGLGMAASVENGNVVYHLSNLHGDVVATQASSSPSTVASYSESDEFGNPTSSNVSGESRRYGWLGAKQRSASNVGGFVTMGMRLYNPVTGSFTTPDSVHDGNETRYGYPADPCNQFDITGMSCNKAQSDWWSVWIGIKHWGSWKKVDTGSTTWIKATIGEIYGFVPFRIRIEEKNVRRGWRQGLFVACRRQENGRYELEYRYGHAEMAQYRWKWRAYALWLPMPSSWFNGKEAIYWDL